MQNQIPENWQKVRLGELASFYYGKMPERERLNRGGPFVVYSGYQNVGYYDDYNSDEDLIVVARGVGGTGDIKISPAKSFVTNLSIVIKLKQGIIDKNYLYYKYKLRGLRYLDSGSAQSQITIADLEKLEIDLPPITVQQKIVAILSIYDDKIELNNKIAKNLEGTTQSIFKEWFVKFKFPEYEKVKMVDSGLGEIPEGWGVKNIMETVKRIPVGKKFEDKTALQTGKVPILDQGESGFIGFHNEEPGVFASIEKPVVIFTNHTCNYRLITFSFSAIQNVLPYIGDNDYPTLFVYYLTKGKIKMQEYKGHWPEFEHQVFVIPPVELAVKFIENIKPMVAKIIEIETENKKLAQMRDLLLPKLMKGEIRA